MCDTRTVQPSVFQAAAVVHPIAAELERASEWLGQHRELLETISRCVAGSTTCGRDGLSCETILRCAVLKHLMGYSYRELEFALLDSASMQHFVRVDPFRVLELSRFGGQATSAFRDTVADRTVLPTECRVKGTIPHAGRLRAAETASIAGSCTRVAGGGRSAVAAKRQG